MKKSHLNLFITAIAATLLFTECSPNQEYKVIDGFTQGTTYHIVYEYPGKDSLNSVIDEILTSIDNSMSVYNPKSIVSVINSGRDTTLDSLFINVFNKSVEINKISAGAFDISGAPLFEAWGFGSGKRVTDMTKPVVDSLLQYVGMDKVKIENGKLIKLKDGVRLNFNAIAQGYTSDVIADEFDKRGIKNYLIEVGGEIYCKGYNSKGDEWSVGIDRPEEGNVIPGEEVQAILLLKDRGLATSGNYRKFIEENGEKFSHTIDPRSGYPVKNRLLSATVIAPDAMTADALATFFMVDGLERAKAFLLENPEIDAYLIYSEEGAFRSYITSGIKIKK